MKAEFSATKEEEHAVSKAMLGPVRPNTYDVLPGVTLLKKAVAANADVQCDPGTLVDAKSQLKSQLARPTYTPRRPALPISLEILGVMILSVPVSTSRCWGSVMEASRKDIWNNSWSKASGDEMNAANADGRFFTLPTFSASQREIGTLSGRS